MKNKKTILAILVAILLTMVLVTVFDIGQLSQGKIKIRNVKNLKEFIESGQDVRETNQIQTLSGKVKELNLQVLMIDAEMCYVAEPCKSGKCDSINDYRNPKSAVLTFEPGTLRILDRERAEKLGYGQKVMKCTSSSLTPEEQIKVQNQVKTAMNFMESWTGGKLKITPHFHHTKASIAIGDLPEEDNDIGFATGKNPDMEQFTEIAKEAGVDFKNMDLFVSYTDPEPDNDTGLLVQAYIGETSGMINGIPAVKMMAVPDNSWTMVPATIHELTHVINIGQYSVSGLEDVYGIENSESNRKYDEESNPRPHCTANAHIKNGKPDPYSYFPDSYNWLDPMWNSDPLNKNAGAEKISYCLDGELSYPNTNPIDPSDNYSDIRQFSVHSKYYKFVYETHFSPAMAEKLETSFCKNGKKDTTVFDGMLGEFSEDSGGICSDLVNKPCKDGLCLDLKTDKYTFADVANNAEVLAENVRSGWFNGNAKVAVSPSSNFSELEEFTIVADILPTGEDGYMPIFVNPWRYELILVGKKDILLNVRDSYAGNSENGFVEIYKSGAIPLDGKYHEVRGILEDGILKIYVDGEMVLSSEQKFQGKIRYQFGGNDESNLYVGYSPVWDKYFQGTIKSVKLYNKVFKPEPIEIEEETSNGNGFRENGINIENLIQPGKYEVEEDEESDSLLIKILRERIKR